MATPVRTRLDPRYYQIAVLSGLFLYGLIRLRFDIPALQAVLSLGTAIGTQYLCTRLWRLPAFDPKSALISGLSLCLLLRTNVPMLAVAAGAITIASKFALRWRGKHIWNPTNLGIVAMLVWTDSVWVSPGQWGSAAFFGFLTACLGGLVVNRAERGDVTYAFLASWSAILFSRALWLGQPMTIPLHQLQSGALLIFSFFMISDPKTTPNSRAGRILFAAIVALAAGFVQFVLFRTNGLLWSLAALSATVPLIDRVLPGARYEWTPPTTPSSVYGRTSRELDMKRYRNATRVIPAAPLLALALLAPHAEGFCGFYVASGDAKIFNRASKVVIARDGDRTVVTMASDFQGDPKEFAVVVPVPIVPEKSQVHIGDIAWVDHLDAYSAPRLVEYRDPNPCPPSAVAVQGEAKLATRKKDSSTLQITAADLRAVRVEAQYKIDEYEIIILSATEGRGLDRWLTDNGYRIPDRAGPVLESYIKQKMYFFLAKVNLQEQKRLGYTYLRPIQVAYESPKFMLPIRLGMVNAQGPQEMFVMTLTRRGRVETTNYRTVRMPTGMEVPEFVKGEFADFYRSLFAHQQRREREEAVFLEHVWVVTPNTPACDPCVAPYLTPAELRSLGAYWIRLPPQPPGHVVLTRLHLRYDSRHFPEDLQLQETADHENWQARYVIRHPYRGDDECPQLADYRRMVWERRRKEAENFASLTGSDLDGTRRKMGVREDWSEPDEALHWWERGWAR